jgi:hypothetical protein
VLGLKAQTVAPVRAQLWQHPRMCTARAFTSVESRAVRFATRLRSHSGNMQVMAPAGQQQERDKLGLVSPFSPVFDLELEKRANSGNLERCCSEHALAAADAAARPTLFQQILQLCRCTTPVAAQVGFVACCGSCYCSCFLLLCTWQYYEHTALPQHIVLQTLQVLQQCL